jgi:hypothetical protein
MSRTAFAACLVLVLGFPLAGSTISLGGAGAGALGAAEPPVRVATRVLAQTDTRVDLRLTAEPGVRDTLTTLVQVSDRGAIELSIGAVEFVRSGGAPAHAPADFDPGRLVAISAPAIMRDLRVVTLTFTPGLARLPADVSVSSVDVSIGAGDGPGANEKLRHHRSNSPAFERLYRAEVINFEGATFPAAGSFGADWTSGASGAAGASARARDPRDPPPNGARYLVIAADPFVDPIQPLVDWKALKGMLAKLTPLSEIGSTPEEIRTYIETAYNT